MAKIIILHDLQFTQIDPVWKKNTHAKSFYLQEMH